MGDPAAFDAEQRGQVVGPHPGPVADQVEAALLRRLEPRREQPIRLARSRRGQRPRDGARFRRPFDCPLAFGAQVVRASSRLSTALPDGARQMRASAEA